MDFKEQHPPEIKDVPSGAYKLHAFFKLRDGKDYEKVFDEPISLYEGATSEDLKRKAISDASSLGLHNFGMDTYIVRYPNGQPVKFVLKHESGKEIEFIQNFDSDGYPVY